MFNKHLRIAACLSAFLLVAQSEARAVSEYLELSFQNNSSFSPDDIWITFDNGGGIAPPAFDVTYNNGTSIAFDTYVDQSTTYYNSLSTPIKLSSLTSDFRVNTANGVAVFISYGSEFTNLKVAPGFFSDSTNGTNVFQNFELTRTGGTGDQGNLTNINYFTAPLSITSYSGATKIQSTGFHESTAAIASKLAAVATNSVSSGGKVIRYVGPSTYIGNADPGDYPSFIPYLQSVNQSGVTNSIIKSNAFNTPGPTSADGSKNYDFTINYTSTVGSDGTITLTGNIATKIKDNKTGVTTDGPTFLQADVTISAANASNLNAVIYGQISNSAVTYGTGWDAFKAFVDDPENNITSSGAFEITQGMAIGEISTGVLLGFLGNTNTVEFNGETTALNTMDSYEWWQLNPLKAFSQVQPDHPYYNEWANIIYAASNVGAIDSSATGGYSEVDFNGVYGIPFSDRLGNGPLVNSVQYIDGGTTYDIDKWVIGFGDPVPEMSTAYYVLFTLAGVACVRFHRKRRLLKAVSGVEA